MAVVRRRLQYRGLNVAQAAVGPRPTSGFRSWTSSHIGPDVGRRAFEVGKVITAYVLIQTEVGKAGQVAGAATEINGVQHAYPLTGPYDVIVRAEARNIDALGQLVVSRIQAIYGVTRTLTCPVVHL
jgi:DNA-binding Lrp family transcriptional regulator